MSPRSIALLIGGVFEAAAVVFFVAADDPYMAFMLAITGAGMCIMSFILLHAMTRGDGTKHAELPAWKPISRGAKSAVGTKAPVEAELFADSGPATPATASAPRCFRTAPPASVMLRH